MPGLPYSVMLKKQKKACYLHVLILVDGHCSFAMFNAWSSGAWFPGTPLWLGMEVEEVAFLSVPVDGFFKQKCLKKAFSVLSIFHS